MARERVDDDDDDVDDDDVPFACNAALGEDA